jgi:hypothetical protein
MLLTTTYLGQQQKGNSLLSFRGKKKFSAAEQYSELINASDISSKDMIAGLQNAGGINVTRSSLSVTLHVHCLYFFNVSLYYEGAGIAQSVYRLATCWKVRGSNPGGARFSAPIQTGSGAHPASCTLGTGSFPGVRAAGA